MSDSLKKPTLLVLAAGAGSRYGGLKQIDDVGPAGETIMDYSVYDAIRAGFGKVVFVIRRDIEAAFRSKVGHRFSNSIKVEYVFQELDALPAGYAAPAGRTRPWGTGQAILVARDAISEPFCAINADDFYGAEAYAAAHAHLTAANTSGSNTACMVGYRLRNTLSDHGGVSRGLCTCDEEGFLAHVVETHNIVRRDGQICADAASGGIQYLTGEEIVSMNLWAFNPGIFPHLEARFKTYLEAEGGEQAGEFYIPSVVNTLVQESTIRIRLLTTDASWFGVTYRGDRPHVRASIEKRVAAGVYPSPLF
jgi:UTP-glucose-1-phosphate uridylyltransferase